MSFCAALFGVRCFCFPQFNVFVCNIFVNLLQGALTGFSDHGIFALTNYNCNAASAAGKADFFMTNTLKRTSAVVLSLAMLLLFTLGASAASKLNVGVKFWKESSDKESMANSGIDADRDATLTRQSNGTYTLTLPIKQVSKMGVTGYLTGLTIGDVTYSGTVTGDVAKGTGVLTIKNLPSSVLTGSKVDKALTVTCNIQMDLSVLGEISTTARMCIWNK